MPSVSLDSLSLVPTKHTDTSTWHATPLTTVERQADVVVGE